jgi:uncharacterized protein (TIGR00255 family)
MRSMTGHGRGESTFEGLRLSVELLSVNRKQADIVASLPRELVALDSRIRETLQREIARGRVQVNVVVERMKNLPHAPELNVALAESYYRSMRALQKKLGAPGEITIATVLNAPGVLQISEPPIDPVAVWPAMEKALNKALQQLTRMRETEGRHLAADLTRRTALLQKKVDTIRKLHPGVARRHREALHARIRQAGITVATADERLLKEIALFADRSDVSEELTRIVSHVKQFRDHLTRTEPVGRALDFLAQEIAREFNTLGAKANDAEISQLVFVCKAETEKIREQVQNIE